VGKLRSHENKKLAETAKDAVKKWKNDVAQHKDKAPPAAASTAGAKPPSATTSTSAMNGPVKAEPPAAGGISKVRTALSDGVPNSITNDKARDGSIALLYNAICQDAIDRTHPLVSSLTAATSHILSITKLLEVQILQVTDSGTKPNQAYRSKIRSLFQNIKSNPALRTNLLTGSLSVQRLSTMTNDEMASDERKQENLKIQQENIFKAKGAAPKNATTNQFPCGKCKQRQVSYYQMQTRSADEPMTSIPLRKGGKC
jgi:transcription elongation factor S-II